MAEPKRAKRLIYKSEAVMGNTNVLIDVEYMSPLLRLMKISA